MTREEIKEWLISSLSLLWSRDGDLISRKVKEEALNHRLACYMEGLLSKRGDIADDIRVDIEYDKHHTDLVKLLRVF